MTGSIHPRHLRAHISTPSAAAKASVLKAGWFNTNIFFQSLTDAKAAQREFRDAGYVVELLDEIDPYSNAAWLTVSKPAGNECLDNFCDRVSALAAALEGNTEEYWIV